MINTQERPCLTVAAIIAREQRFLLVEEWIAGRLVRNQPAGHVEPGETLMDAVIRETREETGWDFVPTAILGMYFYLTPDGVPFHRMTFIGDAICHHPTQALDHGIHRADWFSREETAHSNIPPRSPLVLRGIDDYFAGKRYPLDVLVAV